MAEPTSTSVGVLAVIAAGTLSAFFSSLGVTWAIVFFALCGGLFGVSFAPKVGRVRAMAMFPASVLLSAKAGAVIAASFSLGENQAGGIAALVAILFYPLLTVLSGEAPEIVRSVLRKFGVGNGQ